MQILPLSRAVSILLIAKPFATDCGCIFVFLGGETRLTLMLSVCVPQINISDQEASRIATRFNTEGASLCLFHSAYVRLTPLLINLWKT